MKGSFSILLAIVLLAGPSCRRSPEAPTPPDTSSGQDEILLRVGPETVTETDLQYYLSENHGGRGGTEAREQGLTVLARRAQLASAASTAGLREDPIFRAEMSRILIKRHREQALDLELKKIARTPIPEIDLRKRYESQKSRFQSEEKREVAVLWLNPGKNPDRVTAYLKKLNDARSWILGNEELQAHPERGFGKLSIDHSEHPSSKHRGGVIGLLGKGGGMDRWTQSVAEISFTIAKVGEVSKVITGPEGIFLVRYLGRRPEVLRPFEEVRILLEDEERVARRKEKEAGFEARIFKNYPVEGDLRKSATPPPGI